LYKYAGNLISDKAMVFSHGECSLEGRLSVTLRGTLLDRAEGGEWVRRLGSSPTQSQGGGGISLPVLLHKVASSSCKDIGVRGIADDLGITMRSLSRLFRAAMKEDIGAYMRKSRMNIAHELLAMSGNTVKEVASRVGYENVSAFCRAYRKFWGHVPHEDRLKPSHAAHKSKAGPGRR
jgi:transcriptional regulator GlxA family with amidase domain